MVKIILFIFVFIIIFTGALYLGIFELIGVNIDIFKSDFIAFIPIELRLWFFLIVLGLGIWTVKSLVH